MLHTEEAEPQETAVPHNYTNNIVCPHCGHEHSDSWEISEDTLECSECEKPFEIERDHDVSYTTRIPRPSRAPRREDVGPADLSFRDGVAAPVKREGTVRLYKTCLSVWEEHVDADLRLVLRSLLSVLHARGFALDRDPHTLEHYPTLANGHWLGACEGPGGKLEVTVRLEGRSVEVELSQNHNRSNPNGGRYDFDKYERMPRAMQLRAIALLWVLTERLRAHGYVADEEKCLGLTTPLAVRDVVLGHPELCGGSPQRYFDWHWRSHRPERDAEGFITEKEYGKWRFADRDGVKLRPGDTRLFYDEGHLMQGRVYPSFNGQWIVAYAGKLRSMVVSEFFSADPTTVPRRLVPRQRLRLFRELDKELKAERMLRVAAIARVIAHKDLAGGFT